MESELRMTPILLPVAEACRTLGVGKSTLYTLIADGALTVRKIGRKTLIPAADLERFAAGLPAASTKRGEVA